MTHVRFSLQKKLLIFVGAPLALFVISLILLLNGGKGEGKQEEIKVSPSDITFPVEIAVVRKGELISWISANGYAQALREFEVKPKLSGQIMKLSVQNGMHVHRGEVLMKLDDTEYQLALEQAESRLLNARVEYTLAKAGAPGGRDVSKYNQQLDSLRATYQAAKEKFKDGMITRDEFARIKRDYESLLVYTSVNPEDVVAVKTGLSDALHEYEKAKLNLSYTELFAPFDGIIADCFVREGGYVQSGMTCMKVIDINAVRILCEITEADLLKLKVGDPAIAEFVAIPNRKFYGNVVEINPVIDSQKRTALVTVQVGNSGSLIKPGMFASVRIGGEVLRNVVIVPRSAVLVRDNRPLVFTAEGGMSQWKYVQLGRSNDDYYEIQEGIVAGDTLIVGGNYNLAHQSKIRVQALRQY